jgi:methylamine dehydrogenase light chain
MTKIDDRLEGLMRSIANTTSRRSFLGRTATLLVGAAGLPLLPISRAKGGQSASPEGYNDPSSCNYWRHCAIDGYLCDCCGGSQDACPPGTEMSNVTWIGTCHNSEEDMDYVIAYNDCCGHGACGRCACTRNEGEKPLYTAPKNNDILWCFGTTDKNYNCTVARVLGVAGV